MWPLSHLVRFPMLSALAAEEMSAEKEAHIGSVFAEQFVAHGTFRSLRRAEIRTRCYRTVVILLLFLKVMKLLSMLENLLQVVRRLLFEVHTFLVDDVRIEPIPIESVLRPVSKIAGVELQTRGALQHFVERLVQVFQLLRIGSCRGVLQAKLLQ